MTRYLPMLLAAALVLPACGGGDEEAATPPAAAEVTSSPAADPTREPGTSGEGVTGSEIVLAADPGGDVKYTEEALSAKAGDVTLKFTNEASLPHDVVIERDGDEVGRTEIVSEDSTEATLNLEAGEYTFYCSVGDHRSDGMEGTLTVE